MMPLYFVIKIFFLQNPEHVILQHDNIALKHTMWYVHLCETRPSPASHTQWCYLCRTLCMHIPSQGTGHFQYVLCKTLQFKQFQMNGPTKK